MNATLALKTRTKQWLLCAARFPLVGPGLHMLSALRHGPQTRAQLAQTQAELAELKVLWGNGPGSLASRLHGMAETLDNLAESTPVAFRELRRDLGRQTAETSSLHAALTESLDRLRGGPAGDTAAAPSLRQQADRLDIAINRIEFVRRELMYEMRHGARTTGASDTLRAKGRIVSEDKLRAARAGTLRLNLGCGHQTLADFLNVDRRELPGVDIIAEIDELPLAEGEADEIFSAHTLEHFPQEQLARELLPYWFNLLKTGGRFRAVVPDAQAMLREYSAGTYPYDALREVLYGAQDYDGDFHFNMFTPEHLTDLLTRAGFANVETVAAGRRNGLSYEFEIQATRP